MHIISSVCRSKTKHTSVLSKQNGRAHFPFSSPQNRVKTKRPTQMGFSFWCGNFVNIALESARVRK